MAYFLILLITVWILSPEEFGIASVAVLVFNFSLIFRDLGLSKALIQIDTNIEEATNVVFYINLMLGIVIYIFWFIFADYLNIVFRDVRIGNAVRIQVIQILIGTIGYVYIALYQRDLDFRSLFWSNMILSIIPGFISIPLALLGLSYWSIILGNLIGSFIQVVFLVKTNSWRPKLSINRKIASIILTQGMLMTGESLFTWLINYFDNLLVGIFFGSASIGIYNLGKSLSATIFSVLNSPLLPIIYSSLSRLQKDIKQFIDSYLKFLSIICSLTLPAGVGLFLVGDLIAISFFSTNWISIGVVLSLYGMKSGLQSIFNTNASTMRSIGRVKLNLKINFISLLYTIPFLILGAMEGMEVFLLINLLISTLNLILSFTCVMKILELQIFKIMRKMKNQFITIAVMSIIIRFLREIITAVPIIELFLVVSAGTLIVLFSLIPNRTKVFNLINEFIY